MLARTYSTIHSHDRMMAFSIYSLSGKERKLNGQIFVVHVSIVVSHKLYITVVVLEETYPDFVYF